MANFKKQSKKVLGLFSISILVAGVVIVGLLTREKNNSKQTIIKLGDQNSQSNKNSQTLDLASKTNSPEQICNNPLEEDEGSAILKEYENTNKVDCVFAGCGGLY